MADILRVTTVQADLVLEDVASNLAKFSIALSGLAGATDIIVLPEMFSTGFSMDAQRLAEPMDGRTMQWMAKQAKETGAVVTGSFIATEKGRFFNRLIWMCPDGNFEQYDKRHLFSPASEHETYSAGKKKLLVELNGWKICPLICYDLRFPVWSRNVEGYDLLLYVANWPDRRRHHWRSLLLARAIENQCYVVGVNRCGEDGAGLRYSGDSAVVDFGGKVLHETAEAVEEIFTISISREMLLAYRAGLQFLADSDEFEIFVR